MAREPNPLISPYDHQAVVKLPEEIDVTNSLGLQEALLAAIGRRPAVIIADMSATAFCDCSGMRAILTASRRAAETGVNMRLVAGQPAARRVFELAGMSTVISTYPDLPAALSQPGRRCHPDRALLSR